ncbi:unnamed protein product [Spirodela intermedia]|uniref:Uncharacterized protein n=2 Tax=Spirodela intermedia TaxID=51605 RepID=A0A7I8K911_SPIIN|nr:unnamed protein product [Spirodela intermedia]CAA6658112.1 unnamed protein product [Spirodela intermedia]CAA7394269.1 unnamed protein product [Spirodela intermedia]
MATTCKTPVSPAAAVLLFLIAAAALAPASASRITTYAVPGCKGRSLTWRCGACHNFGIYNKGYFFDYTGGQIALWCCLASSSSQNFSYWFESIKEFSSSSSASSYGLLLT